MKRRSETGAKLLSRLVLPICIAAGLSACGGSTAPAASSAPAAASPQSSSATHLTIPYTALTANSLQYWVANDMSLYKKYGLDVTLVQTGGAPQTLTALQSGAIDAGVFGSPNDYQAKAAGFSELVNLADDRTAAIRIAGGENGRASAVH